MVMAIAADKTKAKAIVAAWLALTFPPRCCTAERL
jgi:hypothetical protein